jgi:hypothetical protein
MGNVFVNQDLNNLKMINLDIVTKNVKNINLETMKINVNVLKIMILFHILDNVLKNVVFMKSEINNTDVFVMSVLNTLLENVSRVVMGKETL